MTEQGPEIIGREILRVMAQLARQDDPMGRNRRKALEEREDTLRWALHAALTGDPARPPGKEVADFLRALRASEGGTS